MTVRWDHDGHPQGIDKDGRLYCLKDGVKLSRAGQQVTAESGRDAPPWSTDVSNVAPHATLFSHRKAKGWEGAFCTAMEEM